MSSPLTCSAYHIKLNNEKGVRGWKWVMPQQHMEISMCLNTET